MAFDEIRTYQFRNLQDSAVNLRAPEVFFIGENGQGKTNFLEAIYTLCLGNSFRTHIGRHMIRTECDVFGIQGLYTRDGESDRLRFAYRDGRKKITLNNDPIRDRKRLIRDFPCIVFCHDDIGFVSGAPERKRWFLNQTMSLFDPAFVDLLRRYNIALKNRNQALKNRDTGLLDAYDLQLSDMGVLIQALRQRTIDEFNTTFSDLYLDISALPRSVDLRYRPNWPAGTDKQQAMERLSESRNKDLLMKTTTTGPHRDSFLFYYGRRNFIQLASTGQQRLLSLILRVAQAQFFHAKSARKPILLLDDVLLELDLNKRRKFIRYMPPYEQAFFTFLPNEPYTEYASRHTLAYTVSDGRFERITAE